MSRAPTIAELLVVIVERYHKDRRAQDSYEDERARKLGRVTLDSFMANVATELSQRYGLSLEGLEPSRGAAITRRGSLLSRPGPGFPAVRTPVREWEGGLVECHVGATSHTADGWCALAVDDARNVEWDS